MQFFMQMNTSIALRNLLMLTLIFILGACNNNNNPEEDLPDFLNEAERRAREQQIINSYLTQNGFESQQLPSGLHYVLLEEGSGERPLSTDIVSVHYRGYILFGNRFDDSYQRGTPIRFQLGTGRIATEGAAIVEENAPRVIQGWIEGLALLSRGEKALIILPSNLAYGREGIRGVIPPYSVLAFEVELVDF
ncbi:MAG: FKBP-type peptidyl-prolyl cis-trans isomerase [Bernardetiaceae bacterium]|nr:FKBP-type peptidyl-prolyl cis-trans isomerase [Bernardetiaceae bacterium]